MKSRLNWIMSLKRTLLGYHVNRITLEGIKTRELASFRCSIYGPNLTCLQALYALGTGQANGIEPLELLLWIGSSSKFTIDYDCNCNY